ncbi:MAG: hypothetical protein D6696_19390 [Acidobacteria bacterium]|nr:MAG: hypothetical protein D6696_19390 [Acidobacteriota bacterium]
MKKSLASLSLSLLLAAPVAGGTLQGVTLPDAKEVAGHSLVLNGMALRKVAIVKVYVAGLYLPAPSRDAAEILAADEPRQMVMRFLRSAGARRICAGWIEGLEANVPGAPAELRAQFDALCEWTGGAEKGTEYVFTYLPGKGTEVKVGGEVKGTAPGKAFADALFSVWIGPDPGPGETFKQQLLGG